MTDIFESLQSRIEALERKERKGLAELLNLSYESAHLVHMIAYRGETNLAGIVREIAHGGEVGFSEVEKALEGLVEEGHVEVLAVEGELRYKASLARKRVGKAPFNIWEVLGDKLE